MTSFDDVVVVIPVLNEAMAIGRVLDELIEIGVPRSRILVIDGGSMDGTPEIAAQRGVRVAMQSGRGKADAVRMAVGLIDSEYMLVMDGDYSYPARYVPVLLEEARRGYDLVIGARRLKGDVQPLLYRLGNRMLTWFFNTLFGARLSDVLSGMYVVKTKVMREILFESRGFGVESEIAAHVVSTTGRVSEVSVEYRRRVGGKKLGVRHGPSILREMVRMAWRYNPTFIIFSASALLLFPGLALAIWLVYRGAAGIAVSPYQGLASLALIMTGLLSFLLSILSLYLKRMEYRLVRRIAVLEQGLGVDKYLTRNKGESISDGDE